MNIRRKTITLLALTCVLTSPVLRADDTPPPPPPADQPPPPPAEHGHDRMKKMREHRLQMLDEKLHLAADQKTQIEAIFTKADEQGRAIRQDESLAPEDKRAKSRDLRKATHDQIRAVLTADQQKIFDTLKEDRPPHDKGGAHDGPPPADAPPPPSGNPT